VGALIRILGQLDSYVGSHFDELLPSFGTWVGEGFYLRRTDDVYSWCGGWEHKRLTTAGTADEYTWGGPLNRLDRAGASDQMAKILDFCMTKLTEMRSDAVNPMDEALEATRNAFRIAVPRCLADAVRKAATKTFYEE